MEFDWDENKRLSNLRKHGIDFRDIRVVFDGDTVMINDDRDDYGETRFITFGLLKGRIIAIVHTDRQNCTRIISARKASKHEQQFFFKQL